MNVRRNHYLALALCAVIIGGAAAYYFFNNRTPEGMTSFDKNYELVLGTYEGTEVHLSEYKRKLLVIHAWASWCTYCADELRTLARLKDVYGDEVQILAVNRAESQAEAQAFTDPLQLDGKIEILLDPTDSFYKDIEGYAMPETVFINDSGDILFHQRGPMKLEEVIERINTLVEGA